MNRESQAKWAGPTAAAGLEKGKVQVFLGKGSVEPCGEKVALVTAAVFLLLRVDWNRKAVKSS